MELWVTWSAAGRAGNVGREEEEEEGAVVARARALTLRTPQPRERVEVLRVLPRLRQGAVVHDRVDPVLAARARAAVRPDIWVRTRRAAWTPAAGANRRAPFLVSCRIGLLDSAVKISILARVLRRARQLTSHDAAQSLTALDGREAAL